MIAVLAVVVGGIILAVIIPMFAPIVAGSDIVCKKLINPIRAVKKLAITVDLMANFKS